MKYVTLNNGLKMPILGFGVFQVAEGQDTEEAVLAAINVGYRLIDTAQVYGNEEAVGRAIKRSGVPREELFITTKLWISSSGYEEAKKAFQVSLEKLGLDYIDLYLIHQPFNDIYGSWRAMTELYKEGKIKSIGVSNFYPDRLVDFILNNEIVPAVNQVETHPFNQQIEENEIMKEYGVQIESWGPFAEGKNEIFKNEVISEIGNKYNKSVAQVILRWLIQRDIVVIPKTVRPERMKENFDVFDFELNTQDMIRITELDTKKSLFINHSSVEAVKLLNSYKL
ncbi:MAG: aldo/keto reductase [Leptotrichiaceae bacterium]|nr:aldo/keto reductase [Leptotrichiaceae bacterium]MBP6281140.1 aldo/keto reductase [Leptotrichiaceae bacterium]MBP7100158.1 aldo/keto reductase [Leptotrichiaceae bacterium]MBP7725414.1 aldo/keto reductase [Leptotrichiaceae bacterium]MBP9630510.1 aldo/keto reductase [Leptotrichiaceae bacterium]